MGGGIIEGRGPCDSSAGAHQTETLSCIKHALLLERSLGMICGLTPPYPPTLKRAHTCASCN